MSYAAVDEILAPWLKRHGLHVFTLYRDGEARCIDVVDDAGDRYQLTVSEPDESRRVRVFAGNLKSKGKRKSRAYESSLSDLERVLEEAYSQVMEWVSQEGHTRMPVP